MDARSYTSTTRTVIWWEFPAGVPLLGRVLQLQLQNCDGLLPVNCVANDLELLLGSISVMLWLVVKM
jgi:hypothetical protein